MLGWSQSADVIEDRSRAWISAEEAACIRISCRETQYSQQVSLAWKFVCLKLITRKWILNTSVFQYDPQRQHRHFF